MPNGNILRPIFHGDNRANKERSPSRLPSAETIRNAALGLGTLATLGTIAYARYRHLKQRTTGQEGQELGDSDHFAMAAAGEHYQYHESKSPSKKPHERKYVTLTRETRRGAQRDDQYRKIVPERQMTPREKASHDKPIAEYRAIVPSGNLTRLDDPTLIVAHGKPRELRVNQHGTKGVEWFRAMFGFLDNDPNQFDSAKEKFKYDAESGELTLAGASLITKWKAGHFTTPKLDDLRRQTKEFMKRGNGQTTVSFVTGDVAILHGALEYAGAVFQAASQFNCLEFYSPTSIPEMGVAIYANDPTQGPACAIACAPGTIVRNYFAFEGKYAQTKDRQINTLRDLIKYLTEQTWEAERILVDVKNGYTDSDEGRLEKIARTIRDMTDEVRDIHMGQLMVGVQKDTQVTCTKTKTENGAPWHEVQSEPADPPLLVTQVYASALAIAYTSAYYVLTKGWPKTSQTPEVQSQLDAIEELWEPLARLVLDAAYEATLHAAVIHAWPDASGRRKVVLTALGGGVLANRREWIASAILRAIAKFKGAALDVVINEWNAGQLDYIKSALRANTETAALVQPAKFGRDARSSRLESARPIVMYTE